jgi:L-alanine-DL-glutamate epimerase-like enolase superfamily enzyme
MTIRTARSWMLRFPSNRLAAERSDEFFELIGVTVIDAGGEEGTGWTFTSDYGGGRAVRALLDDVLLPRLDGREAGEVEVLNEELFHYTHRLGHGIASMAIAAIDVALWDLVARKRGVPISVALGRRRDRVPSYGSGKASPSLPIDDLVETSASYIRDGFDAVKIRVGREPDRDVERVKAVREAIGPGPRILCDANERLSLPAALWLGKRLADLDIYWFEEPILAQDIEGYKRLRSQLPIAIASGEHFHSRRDFAPFVSAGALDVLQPDLCFVGGFTEALKIGEMADMFGLAVAPHFMTVLHIHLAAALPRPTYVEFYPFMDDLIEHGLEVAEGHVLVPERPGHGVTFTHEAWEKYTVR